MIATIALKLLPVLWMIVGPVITGAIRKFVGHIPPGVAPIVSGIATAVVAATTGTVAGIEIPVESAGLEGAAGQVLNDRTPGHGGQTIIDSPQAS
jgi:hypothetical protein